MAACSPEVGTRSERGHSCPQQLSYSRIAENIPAHTCARFPGGQEHQRHARVSVLIGLWGLSALLFANGCGQFFENRPRVKEPTPLKSDASAPQATVSAPPNAPGGSSPAVPPPSHGPQSPPAPPQPPSHPPPPRLWVPPPQHRLPLRAPNPLPLPRRRQRPRCRSRNRGWSMLQKSIWRQSAEICLRLMPFSLVSRRSKERPKRFTST